MHTVARKCMQFHTYIHKYVHYLHPSTHPSIHPSMCPSSHEGKHACLNIYLSLSRSLSLPLSRCIYYIYTHVYTVHSMRYVVMYHVLVGSVLFCCFILHYTMLIFILHHIMPRRYYTTIYTDAICLFCYVMPCYVMHTYVHPRTYIRAYIHK